MVANFMRSVLPLCLRSAWYCSRCPVAVLLRLGNERIAARYCHLNPKVCHTNFMIVWLPPSICCAAQADYNMLMELLTSVPDYFRWAGNRSCFCCLELLHSDLVSLDRR
jgi:hypothetical protein